MLLLFISVTCHAAPFRDCEAIQRSLFRLRYSTTKYCNVKSNPSLRLASWHVPIYRCGCSPASVSPSCTSPGVKGQHRKSSGILSHESWAVKIASLITETHEKLQYLAFASPRNFENLCNKQVIKTTNESHAQNQHTKTDLSDQPSRSRSGL